MDYPIVEVKTSDNITLHGMFFQPMKSETVYLHIHGTGSSFFCETFQPALIQYLSENNIHSLFTNNRGSFALDSWQDTGAALEIFEDCIKDIDAWIQFAFSKGFKNIILSGHSHGTEKVVYYMNKGTYIENIIGVVLMGVCDSFGNQEKFEKENHLHLLSEAREKNLKGKGYELLTGHRKSQAGELPISAMSYLNYFSDDSELSKVTPFRIGLPMPMIASIHVPLLATLGDTGEYTIIPYMEAITALRQSNKHAEVYQISSCDHCYIGREKELITIIESFIKKHNLGN